jgi:hypothetical protein
MASTLGEIKTLVDSLAEKINAPQNVLPTYGYSDDGALPHIEVGENGERYYVVVDHGQELKREVAIDTDDLLYKIFDSVTFSMACKFEGRHRIKGQDFRRLLFARQEELLGSINKGWRLRKKEYHNEILMTHPFDDNTNY